MHGHKNVKIGFTYIEIPEQVPSLGQYFFSKNHISEIHTAGSTADCKHAPLTLQQKSTYFEILMFSRR